MYRIGELAKKLKISTDTLRHYEKSGLLAPPIRSDSGYRLYKESDFYQIRFILRCKAVGFSLKDIKELLSIQLKRDQHSCGEVKQIIQEKRTQIEHKVAELEKFAASLIKLEIACCGGPESAEHCSILEALEDNEGEPDATTD